MKWTGERRNHCQKNVLSKCSKQLWMNSRPEIGTSKTIIVLKIASVSRIPEKSSSCGQRRKCAIWAGVLCICLFEVPSTLLILAVCKVRAINELCNGPPSPSNLCGLAVEHWSVESQGLRFNSSWELRIFLYPMLLIRQKNLSLYVCYCSIYKKLFTFKYPSSWSLLIGSIKRDSLSSELKIQGFGQHWLVLLIYLHISVQWSTLLIKRTWTLATATSHNVTVHL